MCLADLLKLRMKLGKNMLLFTLELPSQMELVSPVNDVLCTTEGPLAADHLKQFTETELVRSFLLTQSYTDSG